MMFSFVELAKTAFWYAASQGCLLNTGLFIAQWGAISVVLIARQWHIHFSKPLKHIYSNEHRLGLFLIFIFVIHGKTNVLTPMENRVRQAWSL